MVDEIFTNKKCRHNFWTPCNVTIKNFFKADFNVQLLSLPRETQICILLYGIPKVDENGEAPGTSANFNDSRQRSSHELASASIPLFNDEGYRILVVYY